MSTWQQGENSSPLAPWLWGASLVVGGVTLAAAAWPEEVSTGETTGSKGGAVLGLLVAGAGEVLLLIAVVATGLLIGLRLARARGYTGGR